MDKLTPEQRHDNMSKIHSKNTKPEKKVMKALRDKGIWFTHHRKDIYGKPDIVFKRKRIAVFIDSDFWHGKANLPKSNQEFWTKKFEYNRQHDLTVNAYLIEQGWTVIRISDNELKKDFDSCIRTILNAVGKG